MPIFGSPINISYVCSVFAITAGLTTGPVGASTSEALEPRGQLGVFIIMSEDRRTKH
jgi:hypothetical protein